MAGTYYTVSAPNVVPGLLVRAESAVKIGTSALYGSLDTTTWVYSTYEASVGLASGQSFDLGQVADISWSHKPSYEAVESFNTSDDYLWDVTGEETMVTIEIQQIDPRVLELAVGTGTMYTIGVERLLTFGGGCTMRNRPISIEFINDSCNAPTSQDALSGISGGVLTIYDAFISSGLEWSMAAKEVNTIPLEFQARPVLARARGNRLGNLYIY